MYFGGAGVAHSEYLFVVLGNVQNRLYNSEETYTNSNRNCNVFHRQLAVAERIACLLGSSIS